MMIDVHYNNNNWSLAASMQNRGTTPIAGVSANINGANIRPLSSNELASQPAQNIPNPRSSVSNSSKDNTESLVQRQSTDNSSPQNSKNVSEDVDQAAAEAKVQQVINQLKARDSEVRAHEMAHLTAAGQYAKGMSFSYQTGPDGKRYAIGGEVGIDSSPVSGDPQATIDKALIIQRAALAPAEPSAQDRKVAQQATQMMAAAQAELQALNRSSSEESLQVSDENQDQSMPSRELNGISINSQNNQSFENTDNSQTGNSLLQDLISERNYFDLRMKATF